MTLHPKSDAEAYDEAVSLWREHIKQRPEDLRLLSNAADFLMPYSLDLAKQYLRTCQELEPDNPQWNERLGHVLSMGQRKRTKQER